VQASCEPDLQNHTSTTAFNFKVYLFSKNFGKPTEIASTCMLLLSTCLQKPGLVGGGAKENYTTNQGLKPQGL